MALNSSRVGLTAGTWDFVHAGHCLHFEECKQYCDYLIVAMQTDPSVDRPGKCKPIMNVEERYTMLRANRYIDAVMLYEREDELYALDLWLPIDVRFMGEDHAGREHHPIKAKLIYTTRSHDYSSTTLRRRCERQVDSG